MSQRRLLLTGFEPWAEHSTNPSGKFVETAPTFPGWAVSYLVLPVDDSCFDLYRQTVSAADPHVVISLGLAAERAEITIERCATRSDKMPSGPNQLFSRLIVNEVTLSDDAGAFYCNDIFYSGLLLAEERDLSVAFVHVPPNVNFDDLNSLIDRLLSAA